MNFSLKYITMQLEVFDLPKSIAFYRDLLGFKLVHGDDTWWAMLKRDDLTLMLNTAYESDKRPAMPDTARVSGHADAEFYITCDDPDAVYQWLREKGWKAKEPVNTRYGMRQVMTKDPDGFVLCFQRWLRPDETGSKDCPGPGAEGSGQNGA